MTERAVAVREFEAAFANEKATKRTLGADAWAIKKRANFEADDVLGHYLTPTGRVVEISTGFYVGHTRFFGVTVRNHARDTKMVWSAAEAGEHFRTLA